MIVTMNRALPPTLALCLRSLVALGIGFVLTFGAIAPHDPESDHEGSALGALVDEAARHPEAPPHLEGSHNAYQPACHICLMLLQTGSRLIAPLAPLPELLRGEPVPIAAAATLSSTASRFSPARAPPAPPFVL
jgi:hypothetical protein